MGEPLANLDELVKAIKILSILRDRILV